jgi:hypothetical protein
MSLGITKCDKPSIDRLKKKKKEQASLSQEVSNWKRRRRRKMASLREGIDTLMLSDRFSANM